jgi:predicted cupin superfamily sugar epimerase
MTAEEVKSLLGLAPHPREGGWFVRTYEADEMLEIGTRYDGPRRTSTAIYYLLEPATFSEMHVLQSDEIFHHYAGGAVDMLQLFADGTSSRVVLGKNLSAGERPQVVVPRGVWQGSRLSVAEGWALLGCTVSPGFEFADYRSGTASELVAGWPDEAEMIAKLTRK